MVVFPVTCIIFPTSSAHSIVGGFRAVGENSGRLCEILGGNQGNEVVVDDGLNYRGVKKKKKGRKSVGDMLTQMRLEKHSLQ